MHLYDESVKVGHTGTTTQQMAGRERYVPPNRGAPILEARELLAVVTMVACQGGGLEAVQAQLDNHQLLNEVRSSIQLALAAEPPGAGGRGAGGRDAPGYGCTHSQRGSARRADSGVEQRAVV